ncbi:MAG TPA: ABC transporter ATP-binding protein [Candidatus Blautia excrementigallinarum]|nr:ABC transporter ATP-binding protein [Candidatus Blautia excrementigallinarum]
MEKNKYIKPSMIQISRLRKVYRLEDEEVVALHSVSADIKKGEICCIFGTSGSGKSTLLNQLAGMEKPTSGAVLIGKTDITKLNERDMVTFRRKHIGFIFQAYNLLPGLTALENVALPMMFQGYPKKERYRRARELLKQVGLEKRIYHYPSQMSGGQQQRVGIARAFVTKPEVVFADEPTGNLDTKTTAQIMGMITDMARENQQTIVLVTHDPHMASYADRIITLIDGEIVKDEKNIPVQETPAGGFNGEKIQNSGKAV